MEKENNQTNEPDIYENTVYLNSLLKKLAPELYDALTGYRYFKKRSLVLFLSAIRILLISGVGANLLMLWWPENGSKGWLWFYIMLIFLGSVLIVQSLMSFRVEVLFERFVEELKNKYDEQEQQKFIDCIQNNLYVKVCVTNEDLNSLFTQEYTKEVAVVKNILLGSLKIFVSRYQSKRLEQNNNRTNKIDDTN